MLFLSLYLLKKNRPKVIVTARNTKAPKTVPAMAATDTEELEVEVGLELDDDVLVGPDGALEVDEGEVLFIQDVSSEAPTVLRSELPPCLPCESTIINMIEVPLKTSATQSKEVDPGGGKSSKEFPPGMRPVIVTGCIAPS